jgi:hypothetical protein
MRSPVSTTTFLRRRRRRLTLTSRHWIKRPRASKPRTRKRSWRTPGGCNRYLTLSWTRKQPWAGFKRGWPRSTHAGTRGRGRRPHASASCAHEAPRGLCCRSRADPAYADHEITLLLRLLRQLRVCPECASLSFWLDSSYMYHNTGGGAVVTSAVEVETGGNFCAEVGFRSCQLWKEAVATPHIGLAWLQSLYTTQTYCCHWSPQYIQTRACSL